MGYFSGLKSLDLVKDRYRKLAIKLHPDIGGSSEEFVRMKEEYERAIKSINRRVKEDKEKASYKGNTYTQTTTLVGHEGIIDDLIDEMLKRGYKRGWVYYRFQVIIKDLGEEIELDDFEYMAERLGYKKGWAKIEYNEYKEH